MTCDAPTKRGGKCRRVVMPLNRRCRRHRCPMPPGNVTGVTCGKPRFHSGSHGEWMPGDAPPGTGLVWRRSDGNYTEVMVVARTSQELTLRAGISGFKWATKDFRKVVRRIVGD